MLSVVARKLGWFPAEGTTADFYKAAARVTMECVFAIAKELGVDGKATLITVQQYMTNFIGGWDGWDYLKMEKVGFAYAQCEVAVDPVLCTQLLNAGWIPPEKMEQFLRGMSFLIVQGIVAHAREVGLNEHTSALVAQRHMQDVLAKYKFTL